MTTRLLKYYMTNDIKTNILTLHYSDTPQVYGNCFKRNKPINHRLKLTSLTFVTNTYFNDPNILKTELAY